MNDRSAEDGVEATLIPAARILGVFLVLLVTGCASMQPAPSQTTPPQTSAPSQTTAPGAEPSIASTNGESAAAEAPAKAPAPPTATERAPKKQSPASAPAASAPAASAPAASAPAASAPTKPAPSLDVATLEKRLRETNAIGVFTKIALKNQVDDLVEQFREVHQKRGKPTQLRQSYDLLFLKVLTLLQDGDPPLAKEIVGSREAIWGILVDPVKFSSL